MTIKDFVLAAEKLWNLIEMGVATIAHRCLIGRNERVGK